jgi:uncharacterized protein (DUF1778 family)
MRAPAEKRTRIVTRIPLRVRKTIEEAASLQGATLNQFVVQAALKDAQEVIKRETTVQLSREETKRLFELLDHPPKPSARMLAAAASYRKHVRDED